MTGEPATKASTWPGRFQAVQAAIATERSVPPAYLGLAMLYGIAYSGAAILLAFILFEDRDLA